jgi:hypothetical protein
VSEPQRDNRAVDAVIEKLHCHGVSKDVRRDTFAGERGAASSRGGDVLGQEVSDAIAAERTAAGVGKQRFNGRRVAFPKPAAKSFQGITTEWSAAFLAALSPAPDVGTRPEDDVFTTQPGDLRNAQAGLHHEQ